VSHTLLFGFDAELAQWACSRIPWADYTPSMRAVGVADGDGADAQLLAVCVYHNYTPIRMIDGKPWYGVCEISFAASSPRWATRRSISNLLRIPFLQYNCRKVVTVIPSSNTRAIEFNKGIGLKPEGTLRHHFAKGVHACIHGMMKSEFTERWEDPQPARRSTGSQAPNGKRLLVSSAAHG
jgi:RimJ/RimL family protein N-acetyltransferase